MKIGKMIYVQGRIHNEPATIVLEGTRSQMTALKDQLDEQLSLAMPEAGCSICFEPEIVSTRH